MTSIDRTAYPQFKRLTSVLVAAARLRGDLAIAAGHQAAAAAAFETTAPRACGCHWPSWRSLTPADCAPPASPGKRSRGCVRPGSA